MPSTLPLKETKHEVFLHRPHSGGTQTVYRFANGYGASVVRHSFSYGGRDGLFELGVVKFADGDYKLTYETPITDDVLGYLTDADVTNTLDEIAALPAKGAA